MPACCHRQAEAEVGHHRDHHGVVGAGARGPGRSRAQMAMMWSPSTTGPGVVDGDQPVGVAVEGQPERRRRRADHGRREVAGVGGAAAVVDVAAVGLGVDDRRPRRRAARTRRGATARAPRRWRSRARRAARRGGDRRGRRRGARRSRSHGAGDAPSTASDGRAGRPGGAPAEHGSQLGLDPLPRRRRGACGRPGAKSLMPLSANGLCEAEIIAPAIASAADTKATAGVGTHAEELHVDALGARSRRPARPRAAGPRRGCRGRRRPGRRRAPAPRRDRGRARARGSARCWPTPRTPSVPNRSATGGRARRSALGVLRSLAGLLEAVLLALLLARVAGEEAGLLQRRRAARGRAR